jgi:tetratricopeptide (TPR) repeat protein
LETMVLEELGWILRRQADHDWGIDAQVETTDSNKRPSGRLLALQIKTGVSYFKNATTGGWYHPVKNQHAQYWWGHSLPVVVVLVDLAENQAYWQLANADTLESTGKHWKIFLPREQIVRAAGEPWALLADEAAAKAADRFDLNLGLVPPTAADGVRTLLSSGDPRAALLLSYLAEHRLRPRKILTSLSKNPPAWLKSIGAAGWRILGAFANEHELFVDSYESFIRAAREPCDPHAAALCWTAAGMQCLNFDPPAARSCFNAALALNSDTPIGQRAKLGLLLVDADSRGEHLIEPTLELIPEPDDHAADPVVQVILARNAKLRGNYAEALLRFESAHESRPRISSYMYELASCLMIRSSSPNNQSQDVPRAISLARKAYEQRRHWGGRSEDALLLLTRALTRAVHDLGRAEAVK